MAKQDKFLLKDPVHGSIELEGNYLISIINSKEFQRLRKIKQLGGNCYVYPGATHTRFEHSIGVCYITSELMKHLKKNHSKLFAEWKDNPDIIKCVQTAALCHDLGHGPFSHLYDSAIHDSDMEFDSPQQQHEYRSVAIFERIAGRIKGFRKNEIDLIGKLITFSEDYKRKYKKPGKEVKQVLNDWLEGEGLARKVKQYKDIIFLFEIVANGITGVDVDKMDYFLRDSHFTGLSSIHFNWRRFIQTSGIVKWEGFNRFCSRKKEAAEIYQLFHIRNQLYRKALKHKTTIGVEHRMLKQVLIEANKDIIIKTNGVQKSILNAWEDMDCFLLLTDSIEDVIMLDLKKVPIDCVAAKDEPPLPIYLKEDNSATAEGIQKARKILQNIRKRKLMKFIGEINPAIIKLHKVAQNSPERYIRLQKKFKEVLKEKEKKIKEENNSLFKKLKLNTVLKKLWTKVINRKLNDAVRGEEYQTLSDLLKSVKYELKRILIYSKGSRVSLSIVDELVDYIIPEPDEVLEECYVLDHLKQECSNSEQLESGSTSTSDDDFAAVDDFAVAVENAKFHYGMEKENPLKNYLFVRKEKVSKQPRWFCLRKDEVSVMLPEKFLEKKWMFYIKRELAPGSKAKYIRKLKKSLEEFKTAHY